MITPTPEFWKIFKETDGALSCTEAVAIMNIAELAPQGTYIELGTHKGKSGMAALFTLRNGEFIAVDPIFEESIIMLKVAKTLTGFCDDSVDIKMVIGYSTNVIPLKNEYAYVFVDSGSHQDGLPMQEVNLLEDRVVQGGIIAFHDFRSQFVEVEGAYEYLKSTGKYEEIPINWDEIISYVNADNLEEGNNSWHHNELKNPCFVGALRRK